MWLTKTWQFTIVSVRLVRLYCEFYIMGRMLYFFPRTQCPQSVKLASNLCECFWTAGLPELSVMTLRFCFNKIASYPRFSEKQSWYNETTQLRINWSSQRQKDTIYCGEGARGMISSYYQKYPSSAVSSQSNEYCATHWEQPWYFNYKICGKPDKKLKSK